MNDNNGKKQEIHWVNALKALCIIFIYVFHCEFYCKFELGTVRLLYLPFFTNAFFFVSGYLLFRKQLSSEIIKLDSSSWMYSLGGQYLNNIIFKLVIPTFLFTIITFIPKLLLRGGDLVMIDGIEAALLGETYWFTCALAVSEILLFFLFFARAKSIWIYMLYGIFALIISLILIYYGVRFFDNDSAPWYYKSGMAATLFLALGGLFWRYESAIDRLFHKKLGQVILLLLIVIYILFSIKLSNKIDYGIADGNINILGIFMMIISTCILIYLCKMIPGNKLVTYVGRHSIGFYFFSGAIPNVIAIVMFRIGFSPSPAIVLLCSVISIIIVLPISYFLNRWMPYIFDLRLVKK